MPIEIKELHIRVTVNAPENNNRQAPPQSTPSPAGESSAAGKDALVAECVEQVIQILQEKRER